MISMELTIINPYTLKILISAREKDSINAISERISLSYGWTYNWIRELSKLGVFKLTRMNLYLNKHNKFYKTTIKYVSNILSKDIQFYYEALSLFGIKYCFTQTDAVFVWTNGGYNISRYKNFYPIFIKVRSEDKPLFEAYCRKLNLKKNKSKAFYKVTYLEDFDVSYCGNIPVDSLQETIKFMEHNIYNFEPALEMIKEIYKKRIKVAYKEAFTNV